MSDHCEQPEQPHQSIITSPPGLPGAVGLYDPAMEKDSCGVAFVAHLKGKRSHQILVDANMALVHMSHRGACGCEKESGDGAGVLTALPHEFFARVASNDLKFDLPAPGHYTAGVLFLPHDSVGRQACKDIFTKHMAEHDLRVLGWRHLPTNNSALGPTAKSREPVMEQVFVAGPPGMDQLSLDRKLYVGRKQAFHEIQASNIEGQESYYVCSLSSRTMIHKGQLTSEQLWNYFPDLSDPDFTTHLAMVHSRFSTNTFPSWERAQPMRYMCHNGEINTLRGNINWTRAREGVFKSDLFGPDLKKLAPVVDFSTSDSGIFDNVLEFMMLAGRTLPEAIMMMIPEPWENHESMPTYKRAFYEYHSCLMEPWDGPASIAFTDGHYIGAVLDRNGLRPSRYYVTHDDRIIMASEVGVLNIAPEMIKAKGRLQPGRMFLVDFEQGRIIPDDELKREVAMRRPYGQWLQNQRIELSDLHPNQEPHGFYPNTLLPRLQAFGYTVEHLNMILQPMAMGSKEPLGSMGNDTPLACLSDQPRLLYDYFKQLFAQVTNPPIDSTREEIIMSLECYIGPEGNLLVTTEQQCHRLHVPHPILTNEQLAALKHVDHRGWRAKMIDITYEKGQGARAKGQEGNQKSDEGAHLLAAVERICNEASQAIIDGFSLVVLSDRAVGPGRIPVSALLATAAVHHHLIRQAQRTRIGIIVESGEPREVHNFCMLAGYGADAVNPYLAFEAVWQMQRDGLIPADMDDAQIVDHIVKAVGKGMLKVMAKMGISTLASYKGAQIFEAVGLNHVVVDKCFTGTPSRIQGVSFDVLEAEALRRHELGYPSRDTQRLPVLANPGDYHWRPEAEQHMWNPQTIAAIQAAARTNSRSAYDQFAKIVNEDTHRRCTLRGLLNFRKNGTGPISIDEVEPAKEIVKRFRTGAMSYGSISKETHETLAIAMNRVGGKSNTGEGGEDYERFVPMPDGDSKNSAIKQVASGRFGVTNFYLANAKELQIKMAQGAKPGEGGELPGHKVSADIARTRHTIPGVMLISPPPHHDIYSIEDLAQLIFDLKNSNPAAKISVKLVSEVGVGTIAAGVAKAHADHILISGHEGGTGASPLTGIKNAGLPWELGIAETHQTLVMNDLRSRVSLETDGQLKTGRDVAIAAMLGAEEFGFSTGPLIALGCIMMRKCHLNTCPVGIATQDPILRKKFTGQPEHVVNYLFMIAEEIRQIMAQLGVRKFVDLVGRVDLLDTADAVNHWKTKGLDLTPLLTAAQKPYPEAGVCKTQEQDHGIADALDHELVRRCRAAIDHDDKVRIDMPIRNVNRTVGTILSCEIAKKRGAAGLPDETIHIKFTGSAGQSAGAWLAAGVTIEIEGDANDYFGKGLSGGRMIIYPPVKSTFKAEENVIIGNVALYGATAGQAFIRGVAAERFCVRNSGATAVIEGVGDHGCEYMTGGRVVILGQAGRNFAAGMSGGVAYVWDIDGNLLQNCNLGMVDLEKVTESADITELHQLIMQHHHHTQSTVAAKILANWEQYRGQFVKVMPVDYKRVLAERKAQGQVVVAKI